MSDDYTKCGNCGEWVAEFHIPDNPEKRIWMHMETASTACQLWAIPARGPSGDRDYLPEPTTRELLAWMDDPANSHLWPSGTHADAVFAYRLNGNRPAVSSTTDRETDLTGPGNVQKTGPDFDRSDRETLAKLMIAHLRALETYDAPYIDDTDIEDVVVDGRFDFLALADAVIAAGYRKQEP